MQTRWSSLGKADSGHPGCWVWGFKSKNTSQRSTLRWKREFSETACGSRARWQPITDFWGLQFGFLFRHHFISLDLSELRRHRKNFQVWGIQVCIPGSRCGHALHLKHSLLPRQGWLHMNSSLPCTDVPLKCPGFHREETWQMGWQSRSKQVPSLNAGAVAPLECTAGLLQK